MTRRQLPAAVPRQQKAGAGRTGAARTPLNMRLFADGHRAELEPYVRERAARKLGKFALHAERVTVRLRDVNGPRGGVDIVCQIKIVVSGAPSIVVEHEAATARAAFDSALGAATRALSSAVKRRGWSARKVAGAPQRAAVRSRAKQQQHGPPIASPDDGSLIGRRVGRARENLLRAAARPEKVRRDVPVDTAAPGRSASDRKAGGGSTAARNTRLNDAGATAALEDSAQQRPSRKSTRRSANRAKRDAPQRIAQVEALRAPGEQAARARTRKR